MISPEHWSLQTPLEAISPAQMEYFQRLGRELTMTSCANFSERTITDLPEAERLIFNDGQTTHLVHSTSPAAAEKISANGFNFNSKAHAPALWVTTHMLEEPTGEGPQELTNSVLLDYQYRKGGTCQPFTAKVVMSLPFSRPGDMSPDGLRLHPHANCALAEPGKYVEIRSEDRFRMPEQFIEGYFDQEEGKFLPNPNFVPFSRAESAATAAVSGLYRAIGAHRSVGRHRREP